MHDAFINSVKEADFLRNGTAKGIMALSKEDSTMLWRAVIERTLISSLSSGLPDFQTISTIYHLQKTPSENPSR